MGSCYYGVHIALGHIHTGIATCNIEESQQRYRLEKANSPRTQLTCTKDMQKINGYCTMGISDIHVYDYVAEQVLLIWISYVYFIFM